MVPYLCRRLLGSSLLILALLSVVFFVIQAAPGDPVEMYASPEVGRQEREAIRSQLGLDRPLAVQYVDWLGDVVLRGDLGTSLQQHRPVAEILGEAIPNTLLLTVTAYVLHMALAIGLGVLMARHRGRLLERIGTILGLTVYSVPGFWLGIMLILIFSRQLGWLPAGGMHAPDAVFLGWPARLTDLLRHMILPVLLLGFGTAISTARYVRNSVAEVLSQDYILAARARGLPERIVQWKHGLRNGLLPVITLAGLSLPFLLGGAVVVEVVFAWPGMGRIAVEAIWARDYPVIMATTVLAALMVVLGNLLADLLYAWADPRVRLTGEVGR
jgi:peptide/nickel transport system permease protein